MKRILYATGSVLTGDAMAHAIGQYATALAQAGKADAICVPVIKDGLVNTVEMVIGPASQLIIEDAGPEYEDLFEAGSYFTELQSKLYAFTNPQHVQPHPPDDIGPAIDEI